ncbi:MAG: serine/threonine-protein kinase [Myxococcota bacterium]
MSQPDDIEDLLGRVWCERYQLLEYIGRGGMGAVFKARQVQMGREVALKVIHRRLCQDEKQIQRFEQEARTSSKLNHPNSIRVFDYGTSDDGRLFMAMEFLKGKTLGQLITDEGTIHPDRVAHIARQMFKSLAEAHELGLVHRDLKPENIFICEIFGETDFVKVLDFGIAKAIGPTEEDAKLTQTGFICGTPRYLSPEQALGQAVDGRADLYSVGVLMYEMLTGRPPFIGENPISIVMKHVHDDPPPIVGIERYGERARQLLWLVDRLLEKNPARRPSPAGKIVGFLDGEVEKAELVGQSGLPSVGRNRPRSLRKISSVSHVPGGHDVAGAVPRSAFRDFGAGSNTTTSKRVAILPDESLPTASAMPPPLPRAAMDGHSSAMRESSAAVGQDETTVVPHTTGGGVPGSVPTSDETALIARPAALQVGHGQGDTRPGETQQLQNAQETRLISQEALASASREHRRAAPAVAEPSPNAGAPSPVPAKPVPPAPQPASQSGPDGPLWAWALAGVAIAVMVLSVFTYTWSRNTDRAPARTAQAAKVVPENAMDQGAVTGQALAAAPVRVNDVPVASAGVTPTAETEAVPVAAEPAPTLGTTGADVGALLGALPQAPIAEAVEVVEAAQPAKKRSRGVEDAEALLEQELRQERRRQQREAEAAERDARKAASVEAARERAAAREECAAKRAEASAARDAARAERKAAYAERKAAEKAAEAEKEAAEKEARAQRRAARDAKRAEAKRAREAKRAASEAAAKAKAEARAKARAAAKAKSKSAPKSKPKKETPKPSGGDPFEPF